MVSASNATSRWVSPRGVEAHAAVRRAVAQRVNLRKAGIGGSGEMSGLSSSAYLLIV
jgi:hypothetical protein